MTERKRLLLRLDPDVYERVARWAADDLRSVNAQIEYALRWALRAAGRAGPRAGDTGVAIDSESPAPSDTASPAVSDSASPAVSDSASPADSDPQRDRQDP